MLTCSTHQHTHVPGLKAGWVGPLHLLIHIRAMAGLAGQATILIDTLESWVWGRE